MEGFKSPESYYFVRHERDKTRETEEDEGEGGRLCRGEEREAYGA